MLGSLNVLFVCLKIYQKLQIGRKRVFGFIFLFLLIMEGCGMHFQIFLNPLHKIV